MRYSYLVCFCSVILLYGLFPVENAHGDDPVSLSLVDSKLWGGMYDVQIVDQYAFCALTQGLLVVDVSDPTTPVIAGRLLLPEGSGRALEIIGNFAYIADGPAGVQIVDVTDPENPTWIGEFKDPSWWVTDIDVEGQYAYLALGGSGLGIVDVSNPASPTLRDVYDTLGSASAVDIVGDYAFIADDQFGVHIASIAGSGPAVYVAQVHVSGVATELSVVDDTLVYCVSTSGLDIVDVSNLDTSIIVGTYPLAGLNSVHVKSGLAYLGHNLGIDMLEVGDPTNPMHLLTVGEGLRARALITVDSILFVVHNDNYNSSLRLFSVAQPQSPLEIGGLPANYSPYKVAVLNGLAAVASGKSGVHLIDISDPYDLQLLASHDTPGWARDVVLDGPNLFVADQDSGLQIFNVSNPQSPLLLNNVPLNGASEALTIQGDYAYVLAEQSGLHIVNVSDPTASFLEGSYLYDVGWNRIAVEGDYAYITGYTAGFEIIDVSDPATPYFVASLFTGDGPKPKAIAVTEGWVYVQQSSRIYTVNVSDPTDPYVVDYYLGSSGEDLVWLNGYLYVADAWNGVRMYSTQYPGTLVEVASGLTPSMARGVAVRGSYVFVADRDNFCSMEIGWPALFCGDMDGSGSEPDIADLVYLVDYMFNDGPPPPFIEVTDVDGSGGPIDIADLVYLVDYMFAGGPEPVCVM